MIARLAAVLLGSLLIAHRIRVVWPAMADRGPVAIGCSSSPISGRRAAGVDNTAPRRKRWPMRNCFTRAAAPSCAHFEAQGWDLWGEPWLREKLKQMATLGYENQVSAVVANLLLRGKIE